MHSKLPRTQRGSASIEYAVVTGVVVAMLIAASDGSNPVALLAQAIIKFYADYSYAISLATP